MRTLARQHPAKPLKFPPTEAFDSPTTRLQSALRRFSRHHPHAQPPHTSKMTKRTKKVGITGQSTPRALPSHAHHQREPSRPHAPRNPTAPVQTCDTNIPYRQVRYPLRCLAPQAGQEDRNQPAQQVHLHVLRQGHGQAPGCWHLELQELQEDGGCIYISGMRCIALVGGH